MKTRKSSLELTPLLDVVLIILFVFMMMLAAQVNESTSVKREAAEAVDMMQADLDRAESEIADKADQLLELEEDYSQLMQASRMTSDQLDKQRELSDKQQETAQNLAKAVAEFIDANEDDIKKLLNENEAPSDEMLDNMVTENIVEELLKFEAIARQFYFIDIELKTANNRLYINNSSTSIGISSDEIDDDNYTSDKVDEIKDLIEEDLEKRQGGSQMVFITLKVHDRQVRQDAWQVVWDAIGGVQEKYGTDKIFRTHITIIKN